MCVWDAMQASYEKVDVDHSGLLDSKELYIAVLLCEWGDRAGGSERWRTA